MLCVLWILRRNSFALLENVGSLAEDLYPTYIFFYFCSIPDLISELADSKLASLFFVQLRVLHNWALEIFCGKRRGADMFTPAQQCLLEILTSVFATICYGQPDQHQLVSAPVVVCLLFCFFLCFCCSTFHAVFSFDWISHSLNISLSFREIFALGQRTPKADTKGKIKKTFSAVLLSAIRHTLPARNTWKLRPPVLCAIFPNLSPSFSLQSYKTRHYPSTE